MSDFESDPRVKRLEAIKHARASAKSNSGQKQQSSSLAWADRARGNVGWRFAICYGAFSVLLVAAHAGQKAGLVEPPVEAATHQQELEASVAEFEESLSKDSRVSVKKDDGEA